MSDRADVKTIYRASCDGHELPDTDSLSREETEQLAADMCACHWDSHTVAERRYVPETEVETLRSLLANAQKEAQMAEQRTVAAKIPGLDPATSSLAEDIYTRHEADFIALADSPPRSGEGGQEREAVGTSDSPRTGKLAESPAEVAPPSPDRGGALSRAQKLAIKAGVLTDWSIRAAQEQHTQLLQRARRWLDKHGDDAMVEALCERGYKVTECP